MAERINIKEIARKANVSIGTVDRVLHNRGRVSQVTKEKVLQIAKEGNYQSNVYARNLKLNKVFNVAVLLPKQDAYWEMQKQGVIRCVSEHAAMGFQYTEYLMNEVNKESKAEFFKKVLDDKPDGIVVAPNLLAEDSAPLALLRRSKTPFVFVDSTITNSGCLSFVGQDAVQSGKVAGRLLTNKYDQNYAVWILMYAEEDMENRTISSRIEGAKLVFAELGIDVQSVNMALENISFDQLAKRLQGVDCPVHIFLPHSKSHLIIKGLSDKLKQIQTRIVGYDLIDENVEYLKSKHIDYLIDQQPTKQGYLAIQALYKHLALKADVPAHQNMPINIITRDNVDNSEDFLINRIG